MDIEYTAVHDGGHYWKVDRIITYDDGRTEEGCHIFPKDALEWRIAEYGLPESAREEALDMILAEPYLTLEEWSGPLPITAASLDARERHRERCATVQQRMKIKKSKDRSPNHPLRRVLDESLVHPQAISLKAEAVARTRQQMAPASTVTILPPEHRRIAELRDALRGTHAPKEN